MSSFLDRVGCDAATPSPAPQHRPGHIMHELPPRSLPGRDDEARNGATTDTAAAARSPSLPDERDRCEPTACTTHTGQPHGHAYRYRTSTQEYRLL